MVEKKHYEKYRDKLFTPHIIKKKIVVDSHNYFQADTGFSTSNFDVLFDFLPDIPANSVREPLL